MTQEEQTTERHNEERKLCTLNDCTTLFRGNRGFPWECGYGWYGEISKACYELETLNILFERFNVAVRMDQIKEKFGTLLMYFSVVRVPPRITSVSFYPFIRLSERIRSTVDFRYGKMTFDAHDVDVAFSLGRDRESIPNTGGFGFVKESHVDLGGKRYFTKTVEGNGTSCGYFYLPKRRFLSWVVMNLCNTIGKMKYRESMWGGKTSKKQKVIMEYLENRAYEIVRDVEKRCFCICEQCGREIDDDSRCETRGWISYLCEKCASSGGRNYKKGVKSEA